MASEERENNSEIEEDEDALLRDQLLRISRRQTSKTRGGLRLRIPRLRRATIGHNTPQHTLQQLDWTASLPNQKVLAPDLVF